MIVAPGVHQKGNHSVTMDFRRNLRATAAMVVGMSAVLLTSCSNSGADSAHAEVDRSAVLRMASNYGVVSFDPHLTPAPATDVGFQRNVYETLVVQAAGDDGQAELKPRLATEWKVSDDALTIDFSLREGVKFQDGTEFDAQAVKLNFDRARSPESTVSSYLETLDYVEVVDPSHLRLHLVERTPDLLWTLAAHVVGNIASPSAFDNDLATRPVGTGPFTLTTFASNEFKFSRWDGYWNVEDVQLAGIDYAVVPDDNARLSGMRSGQFDAAAFTSPADVQAKRLVDSDGFQWQDALNVGPIGLYLNQTKAPFDNPDVRRAISLGIDRVAIAESLFNGSAVPSGQMFSPVNSIGWDPDVDVAEGYDPAKARELIETAGAIGTSLTVAVPQVAVTTTLGQAIQDQLGKIGVDVRLIPFSATEAPAAYRKGDAMAVIQSASLGVDPVSGVSVALLGDRNLGEPSPDLLELAEQAESYPVESEERAAAYVALSGFVAENPENFVPIMIQRNGLLLSPKVLLDRLHLFSENTSKIDWVGVGIRR